MVDRAHMKSLVESKFTVEIHNELLKRWQYRGKFDTLDDAVAYARNQAGRSRQFAVFTVFTGTPKSPGKAVKGHEYRGKK